MTINHHHLTKKKQHDLDFHPPEPTRVGFFVAPTGAAGVDGAPHALTDITVLLADSAAVLTTVTWGAELHGRFVQNVEGLRSVNIWSEHV